MRLIISWLVHTVALLIVAHIIGGIYIANLGNALVAAAVIGLLNVVLRPLFILLTLPINILSLGLFTFVINGGIFYFASRLVPGFVVKGFWSAVGGALLYSIISFLLNTIIKPGRTLTQPPRYRNAIDVEIVKTKKIH